MNLTTQPFIKIFSVKFLLKTDTIGIESRSYGSYLIHCKMRSMKNYHNEHTKIEFGMLIVVILYEFHTSHFAV